MQRVASAPGRTAELIPFLAVLALGLAACRPAERQVEPPEISQEAAIAGISDPEMRERWREAAKAGELPPVEAVPIPERPVSRRSFPPSTLPPAEPAAPVIPATAVADVQPFSLATVERYAGPFEVFRDEPGLLAGRIEGFEEPLELHYKLPGEARQLSVPSTEELRLELRDEVADTAMQRRIILATPAGAVWLLYLSEGSGQPFRATFEELRIGVEQLAPGDDRLSAVAVTYGDRKATVRLGARRTLGELEVFLIGSLTPDPEGDWAPEGQPYFVTLLLYRPK